MVQFIPRVKFFFFFFFFVLHFFLIFFTPGTSGNCDKKNTSNSSSNNGKKKQSSGSKKLQIDTANTNANATYNSANADHNNKKNNWDIIKTSVKKKTWRQKFGLPFMLIATLIPGIGKKKFKTRLVRVQSDENIKKGPGSPTNSSSKWMAHSPLSSFRRRRKEASERYLMHGWEQAVCFFNKLWITYFSPVLRVIFILQFFLTFCSVNTVVELILVLEKEERKLLLLQVLLLITMVV